MSTFGDLSKLFENEDFGIRDFDKYKQNPYIGTLDIKKRGKNIKMATGNNLSVIDEDTGELKKAVICIKREVDREEFVKLYKLHLKSIFNLSQCALRVFLYIMQCSKQNEGIVILNIDDMLDFTEYKTQTPVYKGIAELLNNQFIARSTSALCYYLNPTIFFNGNRIDFVNQYVIHDKKFKKHKS